MRKSVLPSSEPKKKDNAMNREQWMWMRASVALMAAAAAAIKHAARVATLYTIQDPETAVESTIAQLNAIRSK